MIGVYSYSVNKDSPYNDFLYHGSVTNLAAEICIAIYCLEIILNVVLVYGGHRKLVLYLKIFYYYALTTTVTALVLQFIELLNQGYIFFAFEMFALTFAGLCIQVYLIIVVRSLIRKLEVSSPEGYENQLHEIVTGDRKIEGNGIYSPNNTVIPNDN